MYCAPCSPPLPAFLPATCQLGHHGRPQTRPAARNPKIATASPPPASTRAGLGEVDWLAQNAWEADSTAPVLSAPHPVNPHNKPGQPKQRNQTPPSIMHLNYDAPKAGPTGMGSAKRESGQSVLGAAPHGTLVLPSLCSRNARTRAPNCRINNT